MGSGPWVGLMVLEWRLMGIAGMGGPGNGSMGFGGRTPMGISLVFICILFIVELF